MKFAGKKIKEQKLSSYTVYREDEEYVFTVAPIPFGWERRMTEVGLRDFPSAPYRAVKLDGMIVKNKDGKIEYERDETDPDYIANLERAVYHLMNMKLVEALSKDEQVVWESQKPTSNDKTAWREYAESISKEIEESELDREEIQDIIDLADSISSVINPVEGTKSFLGQ